MASTTGSGNAGSVLEQPDCQQSTALVPQTKTKKLDEFPKFNDLPNEIRLMIWDLNSEPRVVQVDNIIRRPGRATRRSAKQKYLYTKSALPAGLQVCKDSRALLLPLYPLAFGTDVQPTKVRFNFSKDTLYINQKFALGFLDLISNLAPKESSSLKNVAIEDYGRLIDEDLPGDDCQLEFRRKYMDKLGGWLDKITGLKNIQLVVDVLDILLREDELEVYEVDLDDFEETQLRKEFGFHVWKHNLKGVELFSGEYPEELAARLPEETYDRDDGAFAMYVEIQPEKIKDWAKEKGAEYVWGWRHLEYPKPPKAHRRAPKKKSSS